MRAEKERDQNSIKRHRIRMGESSSKYKTDFLRSSHIFTFHWRFILSFLQRLYNLCINDENHFLEWKNIKQTRPIHSAQIIWSIVFV